MREGDAADPAPPRREPRPFAAYRFDATHEALDAEALLSGMGVEVRPIPAPPGQVGGCGIALRVPAEQAGQAERLLERAGMRWSSRVEMLDV